MNSYVEVLLTEMCTLVADLGKGGGYLSPSIYDTAQVLRLYPPREGVEAGLEWLLTQQQSDGGWGETATPYARDVPTLAAILALNTYSQDASTRQAIDAGLAFLQRQAAQWAEIPIDALPIAAEMILPYLLEEANQAGIVLDSAPYARLYQLKHQKSQMIAHRPIMAGTPPAHSWEALGKNAASIVLDQAGGIGHSPAATAAWLRQAEQQRELADDCATAQQYLLNAAAATGVDIPGVVPNVWPITGFELAYGSYALLATGLLQQPAIQAVIEPVLDELWLIMQRGQGVSFGEYFTPDVDDTGLAMAVLQATSRPVDSAAVLQFKHGDHFCTFHKELNPSIFANAHALYGLAYTNERYPAAEDFLRKRQGADGRWLADKLHSSWLYTTLEVVLVLSKLGYTQEVEQAVNGLLLHQKADGGWGSGQAATRVETSYALITLSTLQRHRPLHPAEAQALERGYQWLSSAYQLKVPPRESFWLGKELYTPYRVDHIYEVSALLSITLEKVAA